MEAVRVFILTGFLGAGKTTLLNRWLRDPAMADAAVIINEFGDVGLDHLLVEGADESIIELSSGCICCTIRGTLVETLERLLARQSDRALKAIVIETTGLADPLLVMQAVIAHPSLQSVLSLTAVITVVDALNGLETLKTHEVAVRQVAVAERVFVAKCDLTGGRIPGALSNHLRALNGRIDPSHEIEGFLAGCLREPGTTAAVASGPWHDRGYPDSGHHHDHQDDDRAHIQAHASTIKTFTLWRNQPIAKVALDAFLDLLASAHGPKLLRMKGLVQTVEHPDRPVVLHGVQKVFHPPQILDRWPDENRRSRLVFITDGLSEDFVERLYDGFCGIPQVDMADKSVLMDNPLAIAGFNPHPRK